MGERTSDAHRHSTTSVQLRALHRQLRRDHPNLIGIGIGQRRRGGKLVDEFVVRLLVSEKLPRGTHLRKALPKRVSMWTTALGQRVRVKLNTDVEEPPALLPTGFRINNGSATAFAVWQDAAGGTKVGVITCAHCLKPVGELVGVEVGGGSPLAARVIARSELSATGLDVGLAQLEGGWTGVVDAGPGNLLPASIEQLVALMGTDRNDSLSIPAQFWGRATGRFQSVAFYPHFAVPQGNGQVLRFADVVESESGPNTFAPGLSGTGWATDLPGGASLIMAMQSYAAISGTRAVGTHFATAIQWLRRQPGFDSLTAVWTAVSLPQI